jgi:hypothetical protein
MDTLRLAQLYTFIFEDLLSHKQRQVVLAPSLRIEYFQIILTFEILRFNNIDNITIILPFIA